MNRLSRSEEEIRKVVESTEFTMAEADWQAARQLLDEHLPPERKKRRGLWWFFIPLIAFIAVAGWLVYNELGEKPAIKTGSGEKSLITDTLAHTPLTDIVSGSNQETQKDTENNETIENNTSDTKTEMVTAGPGPLMAARYAEQKQDGKGGSGMGGSVYTGSMASPDTEEKGSIPGSKSAGTGEQTVNPAKKSKGSDTGSDKGTKNTGKDTPATPAPGKTRKDTPANPPAKDDSGSTPGKTVPSSAPGTTPGKSVAPGKETPAKEELPPVEPTGGASSPKPVEKTDKPAEDVKPAPDSTATAKKQENSKKKKEPRELKNTLSPVLGWSYYRTLNPFSVKYAQTPWFGLMYNRYWGLKWQWGIGLGYTRVNADSLNKTYATEKYSFGVTATQTTISTQALHYLDIPLLARYELLNRLWLMGGVNTSLLLNTSNRVQETGYTSLSKGAVTSRDATAYRGGLTGFDIQLMLGAEFSLAERWRLGLFYNTGLRDITLNSYYNNSIVNRNSRLQVFLRYDLFRF